MKNYMKEYINRMDKIINNKERVDEELVKEHLIKIKFFMHERLVHFLVTMLFAIMFLIFDVQCVFLFPFAVAMSEFDLYVLIEAAIFTLIMLFSLFYAIKKNILRWQ